MRVLIVAHGHPEQTSGGAEQFSYALFHALKSIGGIDARFLAWSEPSRKGQAPSIVSYGSNPGEFLLQTDGFDRFMLSQKSPEAVRLFLSFLEDFVPDIIHFHHYLNVGVELLSAAKRFRSDSRVLLTCHEYLAICHHHGLMVRTSDFGLCRAAEDDACASCFNTIQADEFARRRAHLKHHLNAVDLFIAPSHFLRRRYVDWGVPERRILVSDNGIAAAPPVTARPLGPDGRRDVFGYFGQIHPFKGLHLLFDAIERLTLGLAGDIDGPKLILHGAHLELNHLDYVQGFKQALERNRARVDFRGPYRQKDLPRLMADVDWVVMPSIWWENAPLVVEEALAHRRPIICSDIGGLREKVRDGLDGFHFPVGNGAALASCMSRLTAEPAIWDGLQGTIRKPALIDAAAARHLELYRSALSLAVDPER